MWTVNGVNFENMFKLSQVTNGCDVPSPMPSPIEAWWHVYWCAPLPKAPPQSCNLVAMVEERFTSSSYSYFHHQTATHSNTIPQHTTSICIHVMYGIYIYVPIYIYMIWYICMHLFIFIMLHCVNSHYAKTHECLRYLRRTMDICPLLCNCSCSNFLS